MKIRKKARGFEVDFSDPASGMRFRRVVPANSITEARVMGEHVRTKMLRDGGFLPWEARNTPLVSEAVADYLATVSALKTLGSQVIDKRALSIFLEICGSIRVGLLTPQKVEQYRIECQQRQLAASGINRFRNTVRHFLGCCRRNGWLKVDLQGCLRDVKGPMREARALQVEELRGMWLAAGSTLKLQMQIALAVAIRRGEIASLEWSYTDFERGVIQIGGTKKFASKSGRSRSVHIPPALAKDLLLHRKQQPPKSLWVFPNLKIDGPIEPLVITRAWARARERAKLQDVQFHDLRATTAVHFAEAGYNETVIAKILGHASTAMSRKYAATVGQNVQKSAVEKAELKFEEMIEKRVVNSAPEKLWQDSGRVAEIISFPKAPEVT